MFLSASSVWCFGTSLPAIINRSKVSGPHAIFEYATRNKISVWYMLLFYFKTIFPDFFHYGGGIGEE